MRLFAGGASTDVITFGTVAALDNVWDGGGTLSIWLKPASALTGGGGNRRVYERSAASNRGFLGTLDAGVTWTPFFECNFDGGLGAWRTTSQETLSVLTHLAITYNANATGNTPTFYVNGTARTTSTTSTPIGTRVSDTGESLYLGNRADGTRPQDGPLAEFALWNRVLTQSEIAALANWFSPLFFTNSLKFMTPLIGRYSPELSFGPNGPAGTVTGATYADHHKILTPTSTPFTLRTPVLTPRPLVTVLCSLRW